MKNYKIEVKIESIVADTRYYTVAYQVFINGKKKAIGEINDDYQNGLTPLEQVKMLREGEALNLIMMRVFS